ncbi:putative bifunctional diguanylate cyclase/phosphodiesterase [Anaerobacillus sp. MEB173]|uniref:putative bifunctional diguanylate cyclase/phosphodiesterase n=1 Tax=Anaerobacillus sp. MEB173 TaxID=3383345 RepID=UPI003F913878
MRKSVRNNKKAKQLSEKQSAHLKTQYPNALFAIKHLAYHDYLTGLPNRYMLEHQLSKQIRKMMMAKQQLAVLSIDLDRFKVINGNAGHQIGDHLLKKVTERLFMCIDSHAALFRQGGDEFFIILPYVNHKLIARVCERILESFSTPFFINNRDFYTSASIGISIFPDDGAFPEQLIRNADIAMYRAKAIGGNGYSFYDHQYVEGQLTPLNMEMDLHKAVDRQELVLHYQPKMNLKTGDVTGAEALIRWNHPKWGMIPPNEFIPIAEESGLIISIGQWALITACRQNKLWHDLGYSTVISVNLSLRQFTHSNLVQIVQNTLVETGLEPQFLELEITESMAANINNTLTTLNALKKLGVKISIDDFGTGFSSFNYIKQFPFDTLKIDQSFIHDLIEHSKDETIVKAMISMAHNLNMNVVAEGIETSEQLQCLQKIDCNEGQGFFFSKPVAASEFENKIREILNESKKLWIKESW